MLSVADIMEQALRRTIAESDAGDLFGTGPDRAISAYRSFWVPETNPGVIIECPLLGAASYDVLVGPYLGRADPSMHLPSANPPACHAAYDWATRLGISPRVDLFFELDADGPERQHAGIHCKHWGRLELATEFYEVIGEGWRAPQYRSVEERLPEGWRAEFAAVFAGRVETPTRLEVLLSPEAQRLVGESPEYLRSCFDQMGFVAYSDQMLRDICRLAGLSRLCSLQFDILHDGTLGSTFSITSCFEAMGSSSFKQFGDDDGIGRVCNTYEQMGVADGRWRLAERALFATKRHVLTGTGFREIVAFTIPNCSKAKWTDAKPQPAKFYFTVAVL